MRKCVFLDRDGVINEERGTYTYKIDDFKIFKGVNEGLKLLHDEGYVLVVITNQAGITRGIYTREDMQRCHNFMMQETDNLIDDIYYASYYPDFSNSLLRKPDSLMFEKAIAKYNIDPASSWMIGNSERDIIPANKLGIQTIIIGKDVTGLKINYVTSDLLAAAKKIITHQNIS
jgi:D-glycero-D-manno-heptose 1,7-bisphosphate phosphatase